MSFKNFIFKKIAKGVIYKDKNNQKVLLKSKLIILAASAIGTPRILLNSSNKYAPNGLAMIQVWLVKILCFIHWDLLKENLNNF